MLHQISILLTLSPYDAYEYIMLTDCYCSRFPIAVGNGLDIPASGSQFALSDSGSDSFDSYSSEHNLSEIEEDYTSVTEETCYTEHFKLPKHFEKVEET